MSKSSKLLEATLREIAPDGKIAIAFSGGVDSTILLEVARKAGFDILPLTFDLKKSLEIEEVLNNDRNRCYFCKSLMMKTLKKEAESRGYSVLIDGTNADDLKEYRPGLRALEENGVLSPIAMSGITKKELRKIGRELHLPIAYKASSPCGLTRFPYGTHVTPEMLDAVESAENYLKELGYEFCRVRVYGKEAKVEVELGLIELPEIDLSHIGKILKPIGVKTVTIDPKGFRSGTMDEGENNG